MHHHVQREEEHDAEDKNKDRTLILEKCIENYILHKDTLNKSQMETGMNYHLRLIFLWCYSIVNVRNVIWRMTDDVEETTESWMARVNGRDDSCQCRTDNINEHSLSTTGKSNYVLTSTPPNRSISWEAACEAVLIMLYVLANGALISWKWASFNTINSYSPLNNR